jgi:hypothetical protein
MREAKINETLSSYFNYNNNNKNNNNNNLNNNNNFNSQKQLQQEQIEKFEKLIPQNYCPYKKNIKINRVNARDAKGPTWARAKGSAMVENEEFCMQTDAHMDFVRKWDVKMLAMWAKTNNEYAVLSTYVYDTVELHNLEENGINGVHEVPNLCMVSYEGINII